MQIAVRTDSFHFHVDQAAKSDAKRRESFGIELRIGDQGDVSLELGRILRDKLADGRAANLFFALDQKLEVHRELAVMHRVQRFGGLDVHVHLALVVRRSAGVDVAVVDGGFKRRRMP